MVHYSAFLAIVLAATSVVNAAPLNKRIAQVNADSTVKWVAACNKANGGEQCNPISVTAFTTLLAAAGPCEQQDAADQMVDLAKTLNSDPDMIKFAQIFAQQARNSPNSLSVPYCQSAPKNAELNGLFQCQYQGDAATFVGGLKVGDPGTIPFGMTTPVSPAGSCAANPSGPITDGSQLTDITSDPGVASSGNAASGAGSGSGASTASTSAAASASGISGNVSGSTASSPASEAPCTDEGASPTATGSAVSAASTSAAGSSTSFQLQNGQDAQKLNAKFATLTASSSCSEGDQACVNGGFAQCVGGKFVITQCAATTTCAALPLVNKEGTSIACTTESDAEARITATGATGGITG